MGLVLFFVKYLRALYPSPDAPDPATMRHADIVSYQVDVPARGYLIGDLALAIFLFLLWAAASFARHHAADPEMFILVGVTGSPIVLVVMHICLTDRYPEVPYIWCTAQAVSIAGRCRVPWKRVVTIKPIFFTDKYGRRNTVGVTLGYIGAKGLETLKVRASSGLSDMGTVCEELRERAVAAGATLYPMDHLIG